MLPLEVFMWMECHCGLSIGYMYTRICTYIYLSHISCDT